jgi:hypothetical protein
MKFTEIFSGDLYATNRLGARNLAFRIDEVQKVDCPRGHDKKGSMVIREFYVAEFAGYPC